MPCHRTGEGWICTGTEEGHAAMLMEQSEQDERDGAAIRRLWDALADLPSSEVVVSITSENIEVTVIAHGVDCDDERNDFVEMTAPTIAEAADRCREALR